MFKIKLHKRACVTMYNNVWCECTAEYIWRFPPTTCFCLISNIQTRARAQQNIVRESVAPGYVCCWLLYKGTEQPAGLYGNNSAGWPMHKFALIRC